MSKGISTTYTSTFPLISYRHHLIPLRPPNPLSLFFLFPPSQLYNSQHGLRGRRLFPPTGATTPLQLRHPPKTRAVRPLLRSGHYNSPNSLLFLRHQHRRQIPLYCDGPTSRKYITKHTNPACILTTNPHTFRAANSRHDSRHNSPASTHRARARSRSRFRPCGLGILRSVQTAYPQSHSRCNRPKPPTP